jgi:hypothetical protein
MTADLRHLIIKQHENGIADRSDFEFSPVIKMIQRFGAVARDYWAFCYQ